jgi:hypothetical protein
MNFANVVLYDLMSHFGVIYNHIHQFEFISLFISLLTILLKFNLLFNILFFLAIIINQIVKTKSVNMYIEKIGYTFTRFVYIFRAIFLSVPQLSLSVCMLCLQTKYSAQYKISLNGDGLILMQYGLDHHYYSGTRYPHEELLSKLYMELEQYFRHGTQPINEANANVTLEKIRLHETWFERCKKDSK